MGGEIIRKLHLYIENDGLIPFSLLLSLFSDSWSLKNRDLSYYDLYNGGCFDSCILLYSMCLGMFSFCCRSSKCTIYEGVFFFILAYYGIISVHPVCNKECRQPDLSSVYEQHYIFVDSLLRRSKMGTKRIFSSGGTYLKAESLCQTKLLTSVCPGV